MLWFLGWLFHSIPNVHCLVLPFCHPPARNTSLPFRSAPPFSSHLCQRPNKDFSSQPLGSCLTLSSECFGNTFVFGLFQHKQLIMHIYDLQSPRTFQDVLTRRVHGLVGKMPVQSWEYWMLQYSWTSQTLPESLCPDTFNVLIWGQGTKWTGSF